MAGRKRDEGCALRLHSSANRGIFVRFLFENKTLPTTLGANKKGDEGGGCALSGLVSFVYGICVSTTNALISASYRRFSPGIRSPVKYG